MLDHSVIKKKPIIGIIGGTGPEATVHFQMTIIKVMQDMIYPEKDQDYYPMIIDNDSTIPDRSYAVLNNQDYIVKLYVNKITKLQSLGVKVIVIACNTAHVFLQEIQKSVKVMLIDIIRETVEDFVDHNKEVKKVGLLSTIGTFTSRIYQEAFIKYNVKVEELTINSLKKVHLAIYGIKAGFCLFSPISKKNTEKLHRVYSNLGIDLNIELIKPPYSLLIEVLEEMKIKKIEHIILGCTELPIMLNVLTLKGLKLYNPAIPTAKRLFHFCKYLENNFTKECNNYKKIKLTQSL